MPYLIGDLQSTRNVGFDTCLGALLQDVADPSQASTPPEELLQKVLERTTQLCNAATGEKAGAAFDAHTLVAAQLKE